MTQPSQTDAAFIMADGTHLPYRAWLPERAQPADNAPNASPGDSPDDTLGAVILALHGMNDSRDAWEYPAPAFAAAGIAVFAPDQRGFGETVQRGHWPGAQALADDATAMARLLRARYPRAKLFLMGESMGAAVLLLAATGETPPPADGYVLVAPAVWGRATMNLFVRSSLWLMTNLFPGLRLDGRAAGKIASDNHEALVKLSRNPRTIKQTRVDAIGGLVDLMGAALRAAPGLRAPALVLSGGKDEIIPPRATRAILAILPAHARQVHYPNGYHLLLRDLGRAEPIGDILAWIRRPDDPLLAEAPAARSSANRH